MEDEEMHVLLCYNMDICHCQVPKYHPPYKEKPREMTKEITSFKYLVAVLIQPYLRLSLDCMLG